MGLGVSRASKTQGRFRAAAAFAVVAALVAALILSSSPPASAVGKKGTKPCGEITEREPINKVNRGRAPLIIGDSTSGAAFTQLRIQGFRVNTQPCRTYAYGLSELKRKVDEGEPLPKIVIMGMGIYGRFNKNMIVRTQRHLGPKRRLGLIVPRRFQVREDLDSKRGAKKRRLIRRIANKDDRIISYDWAKKSANHPDWFATDNLHPNELGQRKFARFLASRTFPHLPPKPGR